MRHTPPRYHFRNLLLIAAVAASPLGAESGIVPRDELQGRYEWLSDAVGDNSLVVLFGKELQIRSNDVEWPLKQDNAVFYYTGLPTPETAFALLRQAGATYTAIFTNLGSPEHETWVGRLPSAEAIRDWTGVDHVGAVAELEQFLGAAMNGRSWQPENNDRWSEPRFLEFYQAILGGEGRLWMDLGRRRSVGAAAEGPANEFAARMATNFPDLRIRNVAPFVRDQMEIKSEWELDRIQRAVDITVEAHQAAMRRAAEAEWEYQVEATIEFVFRDRGACCWAFPSIVAGGDNGTILHYNTNNERIDPNQLLLVDIGAEVDGYAADVTRTFPVSGRFSEAQRDIYDAVADVQEQMVEAVEPGIAYSQLAMASSELLGEHLLELDLIEENTREQVRLYYLHGLSHTLGMDVHDVWEVYRELRPGMVLTIEPGLYIRKKQVLASPVFQAMSGEARERVKAALDKYDGIGVRIEDDVLVTQGGRRNLSAAAPRTADAIEAFMRTR